MNERWILCSHGRRKNKNTVNWRNVQRTKLEQIVHLLNNAGIPLSLEMGKDQVVMELAYAFLCLSCIEISG